jgi:hypothetical protein
VRFVQGDLAITYQHDPDDSSWLQTPDWNHEYTDVIAEILAAMGSDA